MKYEINHDQLKEMLILQKECSDALDQLSDIGIELEGMKLRIPQYYALLNLVFDILGMPMQGFTRLQKDNPTLNNEELCDLHIKLHDQKPYDFCRDNLTEKCFKFLSKNKIDECLNYMSESVAEWEQINNKNKEEQT
jgi:hypothetical protein